MQLTWDTISAFWGIKSEIHPHDEQVNHLVIPLYLLLGIAARVLNDGKLMFLVTLKIHMPYINYLSTPPKTQEKIACYISKKHRHYVYTFKNRSYRNGREGRSSWYKQSVRWRKGPVHAQFIMLSFHSSLPVTTES